MFTYSALMQTTAKVPWWKRLLLALFAILVCLFVYSAFLAIGGAARLGELHGPFFKQGGTAQAGALFFFIGGYVALACFLLIAAPSSSSSR